MEARTMARPNYDVEVFARRLDGWGQIDSASDADYMLELLACGGEIMRFRLTYAGPLKSAGKGSVRGGGGNSGFDRGVGLGWSSAWRSRVELRRCHH
jgi:hypothetical protein